jgi:hypothetical protein
MEYSITPDSTGKYIVVKIKGALEFQDSMHIIIEAHDTGAQLGIQQYLMDVTEAPHSWPLGRDYMFINQDLQQQAKFNRSALTVVLTAPEDRSYDFILTVAMNAGLNIRVFRDRQAALEFLLIG